MTDRPAGAPREREPVGVTRFCLIALTVVTAFAVLEISRPITAPILLALVAAMILDPIQSALERIGIKGFVAATVILLLIAVLGTIMALVIEPLVWRVAEEIPRLRFEMRGIITDMRYYLQGVEDFNDEIQKAVNPEGNGQTDGSAQAASAVPTVVDAALLAPVLIGQALIALGTLFFALTCRHAAYDGLAAILGGSGRTRRLVAKAEHRVAQYFGTIALINFGLGAALATGLALMGMPLPVVWGGAAMFLNFILYLGPGALAVALLLAGIVNFDGLMVLAPMALFLSLNAVEAQFVTPTLVGRRMSINPLLVFLSVVFWIWFWGPVGGIIAIPLLVFGMALAEVDDPVVDPAGGAPEPVV